MSKESDELADALVEEWATWLDPEFIEQAKPELRTLAREAAELGGKKSLEDAADDVYNEPGPWDLGYAPWLRYRAEQIGKELEHE